MDLTGQLSNPPTQVVRLIENAKSQVRTRVTALVASSQRQKQVHLSRRQQLELVERYRAGALQRELAEAYGIARATVSEIVKRHGAVRQRGLTPEQIDRAIVAYKDGRSLAAIRRELAADANTVRSQLLAHGVTMRPRRGTRGSLVGGGR